MNTIKQNESGLQVPLIALLITTCVLFSGCTSQQTSKQKVYHVGILSGVDLFMGIVSNFTEELGKLGYIEGKNIVYDMHKTNVEPGKEKQILRKFVEDKVDLIFCFNTEVALAAKDIAKGTGIPIVFANAFTEGNNLVESVQQPGGDITGVRYPGFDIAVQRLEIMHELAPHAKRIWLPYYQSDYLPNELEVLRLDAASLNITLIEFLSKNLPSLQAELERRSQSNDIGFDAVLLIPEALSITKAAFETIAEFTRSRKIPVGGSAIVTEDYGTVFAVTVNNDEIGRDAAHLVVKILQGTPAGTIMVTTPQTHLRINYKVAQELGLTVPEGLLAKADEIIR
jgi:putative ABC transport system substrate-binding protein